MSERKIKIKTDISGHGTVEVHGRDISKLVAGMDIKVRAGRPTQVTIYLPPIETDLGILARAELITITHAQLDPPEDVEVHQNVAFPGGPVSTHWVQKGGFEHHTNCPGCRAIRA